MSRRGLLPRPGSAAGGPAALDLGFFIVSSTDSMRVAASTAPIMALLLTTAGSQTHNSKLSETSSFVMSTPNQILPIKKSV